MNCADICLSIVLGTLVVVLCGNLGVKVYEKSGGKLEEKYRLCSFLALPGIVMILIFLLCLPDRQMSGTSGTGMASAPVMQSFSQAKTMYRFKPTYVM